MVWYQKLDEKTEKYLPDLEIRHDEPMSRHTSFKIGGPAKRMAFPKNGEQLVLLTHFAGECGVETLLLGNGTNLLIPDEGLDRLVIDMSAGMHKMRCAGGEQIYAEAGVSLARLADFARKNALTGLEFAQGIPGTLGGAVCMNAGAYGGEMRQVVRLVTILDPESGVFHLSGEEMQFGYRHSILTEHPDWVILSSELHLEKGDEEEIQARMADLMKRRKASQPLEFPSAGSTFKRPEGYYAGTLIDQCGLKGLTVGGAQVSEKHAGFVINRGSATFQDVIELIQRIQDCVLSAKGYPTGAGGQNC